MKREPLIIRASVVAFCQALFTTVVLMNWWKLTPEQVAGWMGVIALGGTMVVVVWSRGKVTPVEIGLEEVNEDLDDKPDHRAVRQPEKSPTTDDEW